jgi:SAM-dependent methyltransferase
MELSKTEKVLAGLHLILADYADGRFPPKFEAAETTHAAEVAYRHSLPGHTSAEVSEGGMRKPYWFGGPVRGYLQAVIELVRVLERLGLHPPQRLMELGSGSGWMAECFGQMGFSVTGTTIDPTDVADARQRCEALRTKKLEVDLEFRVSAMETVYEAVRDRAPFDGAWVFEALHHAHDWRATFASVYECLRPGGWFIVAQEPNLLHTFISYRVARLSNTHEIGLSRRAMCAELRRIGFKKVIVLKNRFHGFLRPHWLAAQK